MTIIDHSFHVIIEHSFPDQSVRTDDLRDQYFNDSEPTIDPAIATILLDQYFNAPERLDQPVFKTEPQAGVTEGASRAVGGYMRYMALGLYEVHDVGGYMNYRPLVRYGQLGSNLRYGARTFHQGVTRKNGLFVTI